MQTCYLFIARFLHHVQLFEMRLSIPDRFFSPELCLYKHTSNHYGNPVYAWLQALSELMQQLGHEKKLTDFNLVYIVHRDCSCCFILSVVQLS